MKILCTGLNGLVGSRIYELIGDSYEFISVSRSTGVDITDKEQITAAIASHKPDVILHLAAITDVDGCEKEKDLGEESVCWKTNVLGTEYIAHAAQQIHAKLIYISTDFVFDGENPPPGGYTEEDTPRPVDWYAHTKYEGEKRVQAISSPWLILRIASPYRKAFEKKDFFRAILGRLEAGDEVKAVTDCWICPTYIDDIARAVSLLIEKNQTGIFHVVGSEAVTPYVAAHTIARVYNVDDSLITPISHEEFFKNRAPRSFKSIVNNDKIGRLGVDMKTFTEGLEDIKR
jgi:dTDP-4-dehydrorhamnose reductase